MESTAQFSALKPESKVSATSKNRPGRVRRFHSCILVLVSFDVPQAHQQSLKPFTPAQALASMTPQHCDKRITLACPSCGSFSSSVWLVWLVCFLAFCSSSCCFIRVLSICFFVAGLVVSLEAFIVFTFRWCLVQVALILFDCVVCSFSFSSVIKGVVCVFE